MFAGMTKARFRITIKSQAGTTIGAENDAAAGALMLGAARAAMSLRCHALFLTRDEVVIETFNEPSADLLQMLQVLGDDYHAATVGAGQTVFDRVKVESITSLSADDSAAALLAAKLASGQPGSSVTRPFAGGRLRVLFTPGDTTATAEPNTTASRELLPGDDIADPTPMFARDEATGEWVESDRDPTIV